MMLQIRNLLVREKVARLAKLERKTMTQAVHDAVDSRLAQVEKKKSFAEIAAEIRADLDKISKPGGRMLTKDEIDELWWG